MVVFFSNKLSFAEQNYTASDRELLRFLYFLERFIGYLEGSGFDIFTDNQVFKQFFTKAKLTRREARWLETFGNFGIFPVTLKPELIHILGDTLSRAPQLSINDLEVLKLELENMFQN